MAPVNAAAPPPILGQAHIPVQCRTRLVSSRFLVFLLVKLMVAKFNILIYLLSNKYFILFTIFSNNITNIKNSIMLLSVQW
jgi:hypothetical protein